MHNNEKLSLLIKHQLPEFIQDQHETFIAFLQAYYEWMEITRNAVDSFKNIPTYRNIDDTLSLFIDFFRKEFLEGIPATTLADKRLLVKHIKDFYLTKGTDNSIRLLFRILFNEDVTIYYPGDDLLRASHGKWQVDYTIKTTGNSDTGDFKGREIIGNSSGATATVEVVKDFTTFNNVFIKEIFLNKSTIKGTFIVGETISAVNDDDEIITDEIRQIIIEPTITTKGTGYEKGDTFSIQFTDSNGVHILTTGTVKTIDSVGGILTVKLTGYPVNESFGGLTVNFTGSGDGNATGTLNFSAVATYAGRWLNNDGKLSEDKRLQDNFFWQDFSYVLRSPIPIATFKDLTEKATHPAGMLAFAEVVQSDAQLLALAELPTILNEVLNLIEIAQSYVRKVEFATNLSEIQSYFNGLTTDSVELKDLSLKHIFGWRTSPVNANPAYENNLHKYSFNQPLKRPLERGLYTAVSPVEIIP